MHAAEPETHIDFWTEVLRANFLRGPLANVRICKVNRVSEELASKLYYYNEHWSLWRGTVFLGLLCCNTNRWLWMASENRRFGAHGYVSGTREDIFRLVQKELTTETHTLRGNNTPQP